MGNEHPVLQKVVPMFLGFLCLLHVLNLFWFYIMIKGAVNRIAGMLCGGDTPKGSRPLKSKCN